MKMHSTSHPVLTYMKICTQFLTLCKCVAGIHQFYSANSIKIDSILLMASTTVSVGSLDSFSPNKIQYCITSAAGFAVQMDSSDLLDGPIRNKNDNIIGKKLIQVHKDIRL